MSEVDPGTVESFAVHGSGISALALARELGKSMVIAPPSNTQFENASQHAQCVVHRGFVYAGKVSQQKIDPLVAAQLYQASKLWDGIFEKPDINQNDRKHGMVWLVTNDKDRSAVQSEFSLLCAALAKKLPALRPEIEARFKPKLVNSESHANLPGVEETLNNLNIDRPGVATFAIDQWVVRPCSALEYFAQFAVVRTESEIAVEDLRNISLKALGRSQFSDATKIQVYTRDFWLIMAKGDLPLINVVLYRIFTDCRSSFFCSALIVSHRCDDGSVVWLIDSNAFDTRHGAAGANPSRTNFDRLISAVKALVKVEANAIEKASWHQHKVQLPEFTSLDSNVVDQSVKVVKDVLHVYTPRFTLAPLVAQHASSTIRGMPDRTHVVPEVSEDIGPIDKAVDFWTRQIAQFEGFAGFFAKLA